MRDDSCPVVEITLPDDLRDAAAGGDTAVRATFPTASNGRIWYHRGLPMARHRHGSVPRTPRHRIELEAADFLTGRVTADVRRLLSLIHDVNPTGRALSRAEEQARYALKARLQSLLVRAFRDELRVQPEGIGANTVSLLHRSLRVDGCHAVVADLDDDARAWVQWQLDTAMPSAPPPAAEAPGARARPDRSDALSLGRAALAAYDYDAARQHLEHALAAAPAAAPVLLELLVDHLGDDEAALRLAERLDEQALGRADVRAPLGLAHARSGHREAAEEIARTLPPTRAAEVYVALGRVAQRAEDVAYLRETLDAVRKADPTRPEILSLVGGLARLEARERSAMEEALQRSLQARERSETERSARAILARWPESEPARRALRELREREQVDARERHVGEAARALEAHNLGAARAAINAARALGADVTALEDQVNRARATARETSERAQVERVAGAFLRGETEGALGEYLDLDETQRSRVRSAAPIEVITWVDEIVAEAPWSKPGACVAAVVALKRAIEAEARGDGAAAAAALTPHEKLLAHCSAAGALALRLAEARKDEQRRAYQKLLAEARGLLASGEGFDAQRLLDRIDAKVLRDEQAAELTALRERLARLHARAARADRLARSESEGAMFVAHGHARWLVEHAEGAERDRWIGVERGLAARGRERARRWEFDCGSPEAFLAARLALCAGKEAWLDPSGRELVFLSFVGDWCFVDVVDVASARSARSVSLRLPAVVAKFTSLVTRDSVYLLSSGGHVLHLDRATWNVAAWRADEDVVGRGSAVTRRLLAPHGEQVWYLATSERRGQTTVVVDTKTWTVLREVPGHAWAQAVPGPLRAMALYDENARRGRLVDPSGHAIAPIGSPGVRAFSDVVEHPCGRGFLALSRTRKDAHAVRRSLALSAIDPDGAFVDAPLASRCTDDDLAMATSRETGCVFVAFNTLGDERYLAAVDCTGDEPLELYRLLVPRTTTLMSDVNASRVVAVADGYGRLDVVALGRERPRPLLGRVAGSGREVPDVAPPFACQAVEDATSEDPSARKGLDSMARADAAQRRVWVKKLAAENDGAATLVDLVRMFSVIDEQHTALDVANLCTEHFPAHPIVATVRAELHAWFQDWQKALDVLASVNQDELPAHAWHIAGSAHAYLGDAAAARRAWERGLGEGSNDCGLGFCLELLDDAHEGRETRREILHAALAAARLADGCLAHGDQDGAIRALDQPAVYLCADAQLHARLAFACLELPAKTPREALLRRCVFVELLRLCENDKLTSLGDVVIPGAAWDAARIRAVRDRARAWLDSADEWRRWEGAARSGEPMPAERATAAAPVAAPTTNADEPARR